MNSVADYFLMLEERRNGPAHVDYYPLGIVAGLVPDAMKQIFYQAVDQGLVRTWSASVSASDAYGWAAQRIDSAGINNEALDGLRQLAGISGAGSEQDAE